MFRRFFAIFAFAALIGTGATVASMATPAPASAHNVQTVAGTVTCQGHYSITSTGDVYGGVHLIIVLGGTTIYDQAQNGTSAVQTFGPFTGTGATAGESIVAKASDGSQTSGELTLTGGPCSTPTPPLTPIIDPVCLTSLQNPDQPDGYNEFDWTIILPGVVPSGYGMEWSTNGSDWSGAIDWTDQNDPVAGGGWSGPLVTTTYADNGGNTLWVRWANFPTVVTGPVVNDLGLCNKPTPTPSASQSRPVTSATPKPTITPPPTSTNGTSDSDSSSSNPLFLLLICLAFGGLGLVAIEAQRRSLRA